MGNHPHPEAVAAMGVSVGVQWVGMAVEMGGS